MSAALLLTLVSCARVQEPSQPVPAPEENPAAEQPSEPGQNIHYETIGVGIYGGSGASADASSRVSFSETGNDFYWQTGDQILVQRSVSEAALVTVSNAGSGATVTVPLEGEETRAGFAWYPANIAAADAAVGSTTITLPPAYDNYVYPYAPTPMLAVQTASGGVILDQLNFMHLGGALLLTLKVSPYTLQPVKSVTITTDNVCTGTFTASVSGGRYQIPLSGAGGEDNGASVNYTFANAVSPGGEQKLFLPLPVGTFNITRVVAYAEDGTPVAINTEAVSSISMDKPARGRKKSCTVSPVLISSADEWNTFAAEFNKNNSVYPSDVPARLTADLDFTGKDLTSITRTFYGFVSGFKSAAENYCFKNLVVTDNRIFKENRGTIRSVDIDASCSYTVSRNETTDAYYNALLCGQNRGTVACCKASHTMNFAFASVPPKKGANIFAGLVGRNHGTVANCEFAGVIRNTEITSNIPGNQLVGGLVANNYFHEEAGAGVIRDCVFSGQILIGTHAGEQNSADTGGASLASGAAPLLVGGIVARHWASGAVFTGNSTASGSVIDVRGGYVAVNIGGMIGKADVPVSGIQAEPLINQTAVSFYSSTGASGSGDAAVPQSTQIAVGGIVGMCTADVSDVRNEGAVLLSSSDIDFSVSEYCGVGGVAGSISSGALSRCENSVAVKIINTYAGSGNPQTSYPMPWCNGGVVGYVTSAGPFSDCSNSGEVTMEYTGRQITQKGRLTYTGGVFGCIEAAASISSCSNTGSVFAKTRSNFGNITKQLDAAPYGGGLAGAVIGTDASHRVSVLRSTVSAQSSSSLSVHGIAGGLVGYAKYATLGSTSYPCTVSMPVAAYTVSPLGAVQTYTGGIVGCAEYTDVSGCRFDSTISSYPKPGAIAGVLLNGGSIRDCIFDGTITLGGTTGYQRTPALVSLITVENGTLVASNYNLTRNGLRGEMAGVTLNDSNLSAHIVVLKDGSDKTTKNCADISPTPYVTDSGEDAAYLYSE